MVNQWYEAFSEKFTSKSGNESILCMAEFNSELFMGDGRFKQGIYSANVYRLTGDCCPQWKDVTPSWSSQTSGDSMAMQVFNGYLYVGNDQGQVFRSADGDNWIDVTHNLSPPGQIDDMVEFKGYLYLTGDLGIWRTADASSWAPVVGPSPAPNKYGFGDPGNHDQRSLEVLGNYLYVGIGRDDNKGIQLWRTSNGVQWDKFQEVILKPPNIVGPGHVHALKTFKGYLYLGEYHGQGLFRTNGIVGNWQYIPNVVKAGDLFRFTTHDNKLYLGLSLYTNIQSNDPLLYVSSDGINWQPVPGAPTSNPDHSKISAMQSFDNRLYVGFVNPSDSGVVEVMERGPEIVADTYEINDSIATATPVQLNATATDTSVEIHDLTLHENDTDFFKIEYVSDLAKECAGISPSIISLGGPFFAEIYPGYLSICACETYGRSLVLKIYNSKGKLYKQYKTADEVQIKCPSQVFKDSKLYLSVTKPNGKPPIRYKLKVKFSNANGQIFAKLYYKFWEVLPPPYPPPPFIDFIDPAKKYYDFPQMIDLVEGQLTKLIGYRGQIERGDLYHGLGLLAGQWGNNDARERFLQASLAGFQELGIPTREADLLCDLGELYSSTNRVDEAVKHFNAALEIHENLKDLPGMALDHMALGKHHLVNHEPSKSIRSLFQAQQIQSDLGDHRGIILNLTNQAEAFLGLGASEPAVACFILAKNLWSLTEDFDLWEEIDRQESEAAPQIGEEAFKHLRERLSGNAEEVWREAIDKIIG